VFGHSGSQAPQLMHSLVITVAIAILFRPAGERRDGGGRWRGRPPPPASQAGNS